MNLNPDKIMQARIADRLGIAQYWNIMQTVRTVDVSSDTGFQKIFNGYYLVRRNEGWRNTYYRLFEELKPKRATFREIITALYTINGTVEASFSSKMLATLNPDQPIWDSQVLSFLQLELTGKDQEAKLENAIMLYAHIEDWFKQNLNTALAQECFAIFDHTLPNYTQVSKVKKLDFFLWSSQAKG